MAAILIVEDEVDLCNLIRTKLEAEGHSVLQAFDGLAAHRVPPLAQHLFPFIAVASGLAEIPLMIWLLVVGVNDQRWKERASATGERQ